MGTRLTTPLHTGVNSAGSAIGAAATAYCADKYSRKHTIQIAALILVIGAAICAGSVDNAMFMVGRVINGLGVRISTWVTAPPLILSDWCSGHGHPHVSGRGLHA
jgi:MFS family permease